MRRETSGTNDREATPGTETCTTSRPASASLMASPEGGGARRSKGVPSGSARYGASVAGDRESVPVRDKPWRVEACVAWRAQRGPHGPEETLWSTGRSGDFEWLAEALDAVAEVAEELSRATHTVHGHVELLFQDARYLYVPVGGDSLAQIGTTAAIDRLEAICKAAEALFADQDEAFAKRREVNRALRRLMEPPRYRDRATGEEVGKYLLSASRKDWRPGTELVISPDEPTRDGDKWASPSARRYVIVAREGDDLMLDPLDG